MNLVKKIYHNKIFTKIFPTMVSCLSRELSDIETVLDLGCGPNSPLQYCKNIKYSVGVEPFGGYLEKSKERKIHSEYVGKMIQELDYAENSFDAVILMEVIEHLSKEDGLKVLELANNWARKKVVVSTPNDYIEQNPVDGNKFQKHLSGWSVEELEKLGFRCRGLAGLKILRTQSEEDTMGDNILASIKYKPKIFWFAVATLSQAITYYFPKVAFGLFCTRENGKNG